MTKQSQLQQVQIGKETTFGTPVAQTLELAGVLEFTIQPSGEGEELRHLGNYAAFGEVINGVMGTGSLSQDFSYQHAGIVFDSSMATATPSGGGPYVRVYTARTTSNPTRSFYTFAKGDGSDAYSMAGAICAGWTLTVENKSTVKLASEWVASHVNTDTLDSVSPIVGVFASSAQTTFKIGTIGGSLSAIDCDVISAELVYNDGTQIGHGLGAYEGCKYWPSSTPECTITVMLEADNATAQALYESLLGTSPSSPKREIQLGITDGTANNIATFDVSAYLPVGTQPSIYPDTDGRATVELAMRAYYDSGSNLTSFLDISLTNQVAAYFA